ncbi:DUF3299 domain-containing protein [Kordiimonas sp. SCSIO 12610]|uniref:DUF3299 domain-containing protein n=1 Tax=Kordiimonas sp. SCSIO 12610 TaxID=2829597 RepID=UPI00210EA94B|nr:DUF3299 domain-containing protein [Kordiimonas sp. SCSIO 12610]UTW54363.1 DUF3299 domain-containing protein [Kordiimonas sp. SCSIO 12610]
MNIVQSFIITTICVLGLSITSHAQFFKQERGLDLLDDGETQIWLPAPPPPGAIDWNILIDVETREEVVDDFIQAIPTFPAHVKVLDKTTVKLNGYMLPLEAGDKQSHFILQAFPHSCPFHLAGGPGGYVEIMADIPIEFSYEPVLIEGYFQLLEDFSGGVFYRISAARVVKQK